VEAGWLAKGLGGACVEVMVVNTSGIGVELPSQPASSVLKARIFVTPRILWRGLMLNYFFIRLSDRGAFP
jgi:hypothetical protein